MGYYGNLEKKVLVQKLRKKGYSYREIEEKTSISKSTISKYCKNIKLTKKQTERLIKNQKNGLMKASLLGSKANKEKRLLEEKKLLKKGVEQIGNLSCRDKFIAGIALYQGDGAKTGSTLDFTNSHPETIKFMVSWFCKFCDIQKKELKFSLWLHDNLNEERAIIFWCKYLGVNQKQFRKTYFAVNKTDSKKIRKNLHEFGIIKIRFYSASKLRLVLGWIKGILSQ